MYKGFGARDSCLLEGFHGSKRESRAPKPLYIFAQPLYVQRFALTEKPLYMEPHAHGPDSVTYMNESCHKYE